MLSASLYITFCSAKNRIRVRLKRLREPRYLLGAIAGAAYFYFVIFGRGRGSEQSATRRRGRSVASLSALAATGPAFAGVALMVMMAAAWLLPSPSGLLEFTEAETQFLFPAPVSRRQLLIHRLMRSQLGLLFAAIVPAIMFPSGSAGARVRLAVAIWVLLVTIKVHFTGITLARASLTMRGADRRQWGAFVAMLGAVAFVGGAIARAIRAEGAAGFDEKFRRIGEVLTDGLPQVILWPFAALARPIFSEWPGPYLLSLAAAVGVLLVNVVWVLRSDEAFQEATSQAAARRASRRTRDMPTPRARATSWTLPLSGRPEMVFVWKNGMQMLRETNIASLFRYGVPFLILATVISSAYLRESRMTGAAALVGTLAAGLAVMAVMLGPQIVRTDLRQDLLHLDLLKTWPIRGAALIRGEMLWPAVMLVAAAWVAIVCAVLLWTTAFSPSVDQWRISGGIAAAILAPGLVGAQLMIHNAAAVIFPAWVPLGSARPRGLDAMGQRLILFGGIMLGLAVTLAPGAIAGGLTWFAFRGVLGAFVLVPAAAVCTAIVLVEVLTATEALGPAYERLDLSAIERPE